MAARSDARTGTGNTGTAGTDKTLNQKVGLVFGAVYVLVGLIGFAVTGGVGFAEAEGGLLLGIFEVNPLHNLVHLAVGVALAGAAAAGAGASKGVNLAVGAVYALVGVLGFFIGGTSANILALNSADHLLHLASAGLLIAVAMGAGERAGASARTA